MNEYTLNVGVVCPVLSLACAASDASAAQHSFVLEDNSFYFNLYKIRKKIYECIQIYALILKAISSIAKCLLSNAKCHTIYSRLSFSLTLSLSRIYSVEKCSFNK